MSKRKSVIIMLIVFLAIGFATISTTLVLNGILAIGENKDDFNIIFTSAKLDGRKRNDFISEDKKHINFVSNELKSFDDKVELVYEVTNTSRNYDADVQVTCSAGSTELITFEYTPHQMEVASGETKTGTFTASMMQLVDEPTEVPIECTLTATAKERDKFGDEYFDRFSKSGVMMAATNPESNPEGMWSYRSNVTKVIFEDKLIAHETTEGLTFDVSEAQDKSVMAYLVENRETLKTNKDSANKDLEDTTAYTLYIQGDTGVKANPNSSYMFSRFNNLLDLENMKYLDTSSVTNMSSMFDRCTNLSNIDLSNFDTSNVTTMQSMFAASNNLEVIDVRSFDTSNVISMRGMFHSGNSLWLEPRELKEIKGLSSLNTSKVEDMGGMLVGVPFTSLDLSNWDTSSLRNIENMFSQCEKIISINLTNWDTSNIGSFHALFWRCLKLENIYGIENLNTSKVTQLSNVFNECSSLKHLNIEEWDMSSVVNMPSIFGGCNSLTKLEIGNWDTSNVVDMHGAFGGCSKLTELNVSNWDTSKVSFMSSTFSGCSSLKTLDVSNWNTSNVTTMSSLFHGCSALVKLDVANWNTSNVTSMNNLFDTCINLSVVDVSRWDTSNVTSMSLTFYRCNNLTNIDVSNWNTSKVTNMSNMFAYCEKLEALDVSNWVIDNVTDMSSMFGYLRKVTTLDVSDWNTSNVTAMRAMFVECNNLTTADLSNFDLTHIENLNSFVAGCHNLVTTITIRGTNCTEFDGEEWYWSIFTNAAIGTGHITVNYTADASDLVDQMIATKSETSNVTKGVEVV